MNAVVDTLTVLTSISNKHAGKRFKFNPKTGHIRNRSYDSEKFFAVSSIAVGDIIQLGEALTKLSCKPYDFVIRGEPLPGINRKRARRILHPDKKTGDPPSFKEVPRHCFIVDVDHIPRPVTIDPQADPGGAVEYVIGLLPPELHDATCWWQFSSTQGVYPRDETLSLHLWFWNLDPLDDAALTRWALAVNQVAGLKLIDPTLYRAVQPHYITAPAFDGMPDPLPRRCGLRQGLDEAVSLVIPPAAAKHPDEPSPGGYEPGLGIEAYLAKLGGPQGFRAPIVSAIASYISVHGSAAAREPIKQLSAPQSPAPTTGGARRAKSSATRAINTSTKFSIGCSHTTETNRPKASLPSRPRTSSTPRYRSPSPRTRA
jgi:hypothetical protein